MITLKDNKIYTSKEMDELGITKYKRNQMINNSKIKKVAYGKYSTINSFDSNYTIIANICPRGIYSYETALFLLGYSDRIPFVYDVTVPNGYNSRPLKNLTNINLHYKKIENYQLGITSVVEPEGNLVACYEIERVLVEIIANPNKCEKDIFINALKQYINSSYINLNKIQFYAVQFKVEELTRNYLELLL